MYKNELGINHLESAFVVFCHFKYTRLLCVVYAMLALQCMHSDTKFRFVSPTLGPRVTMVILTLYVT
jgi:hypothetical protein